jgi:predicted TPR repeat methyltransferase
VEDRRLSNPRILAQGTRWILSRHQQAFDRSPADAASYHRIAGVSSARAGDTDRARRHFASSLRAQPDARTAARLLVASSSGLARRVWGSDDHYVDRAAMERQGLGAVGGASDDSRRSDSLFLPWKYSENPPASADSGGNPFWEQGTATNDVRFQDPVYRWAARLARDEEHLPVIDIGCGSGHKLVHRVGAVTDRFLGVDQPSGIAIARKEFPDREWLGGDLGDESFWTELSALRARLVLCSDVIEHVEEPRLLLERLARLAGDGHILVSTPDRARLENADSLGPPVNPRHIREWSADELELLCESAGLAVVARRRFLPRRYGWNSVDRNRTAYRALHLRALPDRRSSYALLLRSVESSPRGRAAHR